MNDIMEQLCGKIGDADYQKKSVIVQGITGKFGSRHTKLMLEYGTNIVAGVTPGKGGTKFENIPIYENIRCCKGDRCAHLDCIFAKFFLVAAMELRAPHEKQIFMCNLAFCASCFFAGSVMVIQYAT